MKRSARIARLLTLRERAEKQAAIEEERATFDAARAHRQHNRLENAQRRSTENRSSASISDLHQQDIIIEGTKNAIAAARIAELSTAADADTARRVREIHTRRRRSLEKAHLRIIRIESEQRAQQHIRDIQELSISRHERKDNP